MSSVRTFGTRRATLGLPAVAATVSVVLYFPEAIRLFYWGFTSYEIALPLAGLLFVWIFVSLKRQEFAGLVNTRGWNPALAAVGTGMVAVPYLPLLLDPSLGYSYSYAYAGVAICSCWVGIMVILEPHTLRFLWPYLAAYTVTVGSATVLATVAGDPLSYIVADVGSVMTSVSGLQVHWSSVFFSFTAAGGHPVNLYISEGCSGTVSVSMVFLLIGLMYLDKKGSPRATLALTAGGTLLFVFLNALRVYTIALGGIYGGAGLLSFFHQWAGYAFYAVGYSVIILLYTRNRTDPAVPRL